jgi:hypothetical protein
MISELLAAVVPLLVLVLALVIDRRLRKRIEKPPQTEKLLRPAGYSLCVRLDETLDKMPNAILARCEWGHDDYSLQVENLPKAPRKPWQQELI